MKHLKLTVAALAMLAGTQAVAETQFMGWTQSEETGKAAMAALAESFEGDVELQGYAWGEINKNYILRARSNTLPDVGQVQGRLLPTVAAGANPVDLNEVIGREKLLEIFDAGFLAMGEVNGKQVGLPWITGTIGWVANKEVMAKAGIEAAPTTIEEFKAALKAVKAADPDTVPFGMATKNPNSILLDYLILAWTFGADPISADGKAAVNTPEAIEALEFMVEMVQGGLAAPEIDRPDARRLFAQGNTAFYIDAPQARSFARKFSGRGEEIDGAVLPIAGPVDDAGDTPVSIQWGHILTVFGDKTKRWTATACAGSCIFSPMSSWLITRWASRFCPRRSLARRPMRFSPTLTWRTGWRRRNRRVGTRLRLFRTRPRWPPSWARKSRPRSWVRNRPPRPPLTCSRVWKTPSRNPPMAGRV
ncbi:Sugar ABC transporter, periplasmic sugar-binding protein [Candidatus Rhodobacter oscarellae]|uniref:Sugar ABC transporter, periplasmic sugar-binding protein n=1 Tax=Candidatus Rhodobacter oscarellae TaxID=1675527 RepID=A0A0J9E6C8_9RHOB|nr:extracellular solute-binding protein [Candidatus Rhodobacter lobularis]KMW58325.1 Sugar ABC transporter, periplasmic sugar-binding protein [Candidatus Rhodobacter lobularis]